ncbi:AAI domain-containing protein [Heracleum sosnowskyi]|uniref:AAI domain-containing protein n=1 Tax=Heracleum sosnowskyi TaxID=360622 RepID=A0AAD8N156_9APIA|nr:AAI domain-containing protein [Heracleum sosnowskyi]
MTSPAMLVLTMMVMFYYVNAQSQAPVGVPVVSPMSVPSMAPEPVGETDCTSAIFGMADCIDYVQQGSNATKPVPVCCTEFAGLLKNQPKCLCLLLGDTSSFGIDIDLNKALNLPTACGLQLPSLSDCPAAPSSSPGEAPGSTEVLASSPGGETLGPGVAARPGSENENGAPKISAFGVASFVAVAISFFV